MKTADPDPPTRPEKSQTDDIQMRSVNQATAEQRPLSFAIEGNAVVLRGRLPNGSSFEKEMELSPEIISYLQTLKALMPIVLDFTPLSPLITGKDISSSKAPIKMSPSKSFNIATGMSTDEPIALLGRERGEDLRREFKLDDFDRNNDCARVHVPDNVIAITAPFLVGLFGDSVRSMGPTKFRQKYQFECNASLLPLIDQGLEESLRTYNLPR